MGGVSGAPPRRASRRHIVRHRRVREAVAREAGAVGAHAGLLKQFADGVSAFYRDLAERGQALVFDVLQYGQPVRAFALRFDGKVVAYLNRCAHVPAELDWQPGEFLDMDRRWIICSIHGATYEPETGRCVGGPCGRGLAAPQREPQETENEPAPLACHAGECRRRGAG